MAARMEWVVEEANNKEVRFYEKLTRSTVIVFSSDADSNTVVEETYRMFNKLEEMRKSSNPQTLNFITDYADLGLLWSVASLIGGLGFKLRAFANHPLLKHRTMVGGTGVIRTVRDIVNRAGGHVDSSDSIDNAMRQVLIAEGYDVEESFVPLPDVRKCVPDGVTFRRPGDAVSTGENLATNVERKKRSFITRGDKK